MNRFQGRVEHLIDGIVHLWNQGKLEDVCLCYADDATCIGSFGRVQGKKDILKLYKETFPSPADMGHLALEVLEYREGGAAHDSVASVVLKWTIKNKSGAFWGLSLEVFSAEKGRLKIIQEASIPPLNKEALGTVVGKKPVLQA